MSTDFDYGAWLVELKAAADDELFAKLAECKPPQEPLARAQLREALVKVLKGKVASPAGVADACLGAAGDRAKERDPSDNRPLLPSTGDLRDLTAKAWTHIDGWRSETDHRRFIGRYGTAIARLENAKGNLTTVTIDRARAVNLLAECIAWTNDGDPTFPPPIVAENLLVTPDPPVPSLERIVEVPVLGADGSVRDQAGYDPVTCCFLRPADGLRVRPVKTRPTAADVKEARDLIRELVADFPFRGKAEGDTGDHERAHAYSVLLQPFVRALIPGPTPLHLFDAPAPGTGKTLCAEALSVPALGGRKLPSFAEAHGDEEWRKRITAKLRDAPEYVLIDNIRRQLNSSSLASALTTSSVEDRLLGVSEMVHLPVRCVWIVTGNNATLSDEMTRRCARVRMDAQCEFPEDRDVEFKHPDLLAWAQEQRGELIWATLSLARDWIVAGRPDPVLGARLGGFEGWMHVVGGILEHAELGTILGNTGELRKANRDPSLGTFLEAVWLRLGPREWAAREAVELGQQHLEIGMGPDAQLAQVLGIKLRSFVDRPFTNYTLRRGDDSDHSALWKVEKTS